MFIGMAFTHLLDRKKINKYDQADSHELKRKYDEDSYELKIRKTDVPMKF